MKKKIWVVDDDSGILEVVTIILADNGYQVTCIANATLLKKQLKEETPDLILLDVLLSGADGKELSRAMKIDPKTAQIPVIMMSADTNLEEKFKYSLADDFLRKPFDINDLEKKVKKYVS